MKKFVIQVNEKEKESEVLDLGSSGSKSNNAELSESGQAADFHYEGDKSSQMKMAAKNQLNSKEVSEKNSSNRHNEHTTSNSSLSNQRLAEDSSSSDSSSVREKSKQSTNKIKVKHEHKFK